jgi:hypothetical protein
MNFLSLHLVEIQVGRQQPHVIRNIFTLHVSKCDDYHVRHDCIATHNAILFSSLSFHRARLFSIFEHFTFIAIVVVVRRRRRRRNDPRGDQLLFMFPLRQQQQQKKKRKE